MACSAPAMKGFSWLNATQFLGALNDNVFKFLVFFFLVDHLKMDAAATITLASAIFIIPFLLFSQSAGVLADRMSKRTIILAAKGAELMIMGFSIAAMLLESPAALYMLIFIMCTQSAFFGPAKYGILPELVERERLSRSNGNMVCMTYLAIIFGTFLPSFILVFIFRENYLAVAAACILIALAGLLTGFKIPPTPPAGGVQRFSVLFTVEIFKTMVRIRHEKFLFFAIIGSAYFLFLGGFVQQNILLYGQEILGWSAQRSGFLFPMAALGIGLGSFMAGRISGNTIEVGIVPLGALLLTVCSLTLGLIPPTPRTIFMLMLLTGIGAGLFIVPLNTYIQDRSPPNRRGELLACSNFLSFLGVAVSAALLYVLLKTLGLDPRQCFLVIGLFTGALAIFSFMLLPDFIVRFCIIIITRCFYRIRMEGNGLLPATGGALLVSNHVTIVDALLVSTLTQRRIRFLMQRKLYETHKLKPLLRLMRVIPIADDDPPRQILQALQEARAALDDEYLVCIFAEGALTRNGNLRVFRPGFERILKNSAYPVFPVHIGNAWGSIFSYYHGQPGGSHPRSIPYEVTLQVGSPMPASSTPAELRQAVAVLGCQAFDLLKKPQDTLARRFVCCARRCWRRQAMADTTGKDLTFGRLLIGSLALGSALRQEVKNDTMVGVLLPAAVGGALANLALSLLGKVPVNLNFTTSREAMASAIEQCGIQVVISSRTFLEKLGPGFSPPPGILYLEDIAGAIRTPAKLSALLKARFFPARWLVTGGTNPDSLATVIFSSGSTGDPKGIMLSHYNILANIEQVRQVFRFTPSERFAAVLPFFHSFGLTVTLWAPMVCGFSVFYHPNPLEGAVIGKMIRKHQLSIMVATPTFLLSWMRRAGEGDFTSLRALVTGAEKLPARIADAFEARFGVRPVEGYGATEMSPVISLNIADTEGGGVRQVGTKQGSVGHPVPGVAVRVTDPETGKRLAPGSTGLLQVMGPNRMLGYLGRPDETAMAMEDGWYKTGDIAKEDADGFIFLQDRLTRFSKIGGEMVPHLAIEEALHAALETEERCVVVVAVEDERKGEQLVVCYTPAAGDPHRLHELLAKPSMPNLWRPKKDNYMAIDEIPTLGSGKVDIPGLRKMAAGFVKTRPGRLQKAVNRLRDTI